MKTNESLLKKALGFFFTLLLAGFLTFLVMLVSSYVFGPSFFRSEYCEKDCGLLISGTIMGYVIAIELLLIGAFYYLIRTRAGKTFIPQAETFIFGGTLVLGLLMCAGLNLSSHSDSKKILHSWRKNELTPDISKSFLQNSPVRSVTNTSK